MDKKIPKTKWSAPQLEKHIRSESQNSGNVIFSTHARQRMKVRKITDAYAIQTLRKGQIKLKPELDKFTGDIKCRMEYFIGGIDVKIVVAVSDEDPELIVITAID